MASRVARASDVLKERPINYWPRFTELTGRVTAAVLLQQVLYFWGACNERAFYKFRAPCNHDRYVEGDSWLECLRFSPSEFDTALKTIGTKITQGTSRTDALNGKDVCNLVLYWTDANRMTWYELNEPLLDELLDNLCSDANSGKCNYLDVQESATSIELGNHELHSSEIPENTHIYAASPPPAPLEEEDSDYYTELYCKDKSVTRIGTAKGGPWSVDCPICGNTVTIQELDTWNVCRCGMREFKLLSKKPHTAPNGRRKSEAVEAYYAIVKSRGVRYGANEEYEADITRTVTDLSFWRQVVKDYIHPAFGGNPHGVDKMLVYYNEHRLPGTRKAKEEEPPMPRFRPQEEVEAEMQSRREPEVDISSLPLPPGYHEPQAAIDERLERERLAREAAGHD